MDGWGCVGIARLGSVGKEGLVGLKSEEQICSKGIIILLCFPSCFGVVVAVPNGAWAHAFYTGQFRNLALLLQE